jgi:hypothetical protein
MRKMTSFLLISLFLFGCSTTAHLRTDDSPEITVKESSSENIKVYSASDIGKPDKTIGIVIASTDAGNDSTGAIEKLKEEAALLGADAIVGMNLEVNLGFWTNAIRASGTAVKF